jgi:hypothetical protein
MLANFKPSRYWPFKIISQHLDYQDAKQDAGDLSAKKVLSHLHTLPAPGLADCQVDASDLQAIQVLPFKIISKHLEKKS